MDANHKLDDREMSGSEAVLSTLMIHKNE